MIRGGWDLFDINVCLNKNLVSWRPTEANLNLQGERIGVPLLLPLCPVRVDKGSRIDPHLILKKPHWSAGHQGSNHIKKILTGLHLTLKKSHCSAVLRRLQPGLAAHRPYAAQPLVALHRGRRPSVLACSAVAPSHA